MSEIEHSRELALSNRYGLHLRPAALFVTEANRHQAEVFVSVNGGEEGNGKSILDLTARAAGKGALVRIRTVGEDARQALEALVSVIEDGFDEFGDS